jgi:hypothetical protein
VPPRRPPGTRGAAALSIGPRARAAAFAAALGAVVACAAPPPPAPPDAQALLPPPPGSGAADLLAALDEDPADARVAVRELRLLRAGAEPWQALSRDAAEAEPGRLGVIALRSCRARRGWHRTRVERASWYVLDAGRLLAYDHTAFGPGCASRRHFRPSPADDVETERGLVRFTSQRHPPSQPEPADGLRLGLALVGAGRLDEAEARLAAADATLARLAHVVQHGNEEERVRAEAERAPLAALRATLARSLRTARRAER